MGWRRKRDAVHALMVQSGGMFSGFSSGVITRFAPSPTGLLHLGHAFSAVLGWQLARDGGRWLLRIEDIDSTRCRGEFVAAMHADLAWLGLRPDGEMRQSARMPYYGAVLDDLRARGLLYPCFCTRTDIARAASAPHAGETRRYPGTCRGRVVVDADLERPHAWRLDLAATGLPMRQRWQDVLHGEQWGEADNGGDPVLARKDVPASYHLACVIDDAAMGVNLVTRGEDLAEGTALQRLLQQLLGLPEPRYLHHPLLRDGEGKRLAKRDNAFSLEARRIAGEDGIALRAALVEKAASILG